MIETYMFDKYQNLDPDYIPNNTLHWKFPPDGVRDIVRGSSPEHFLYVPFDVNKDVQELLITYRQGYVLVNKTIEDVRIKEDKVNIIYYTLTPDETRLFKEKLNEPCKVQVRALLTNNKTIASDIYEVQVYDVLDDKELRNENK